MTTYEHAMLGITGSLAAGLHVRYGWKIVALSGIAAVVPDWDGLPMLIDMAAFQQGHRVWGHNLLGCLIVAVLLGMIDYRFDLSGRVAQRLVKFGPFRELQPHIRLREEWSTGTLIVWISVAFCAALSQIPADAVVSGGKGLSDWALQPLWPFSDYQFVYAMVPWGNVGVTIIFAIGMLALFKWKTQVRPIAATTLAAVAAYIVAWGVWMQ